MKNDFLVRNAEAEEKDYNVKIVFEYAESSSPSSPYDRIVRCFIWIYKESLPEDLAFDTASSIGAAWCSKKDNFVKLKGRKISLARAIKALDLPKDERKQIWGAYRFRTIKKEV